PWPTPRLRRASRASSSSASSATRTRCRSSATRSTTSCASGTARAPRREARRSMIATIRDKVLDGKRLDRAEGRWLLADAPLLELGALAAEARRGRFPDVTPHFFTASEIRTVAQVERLTIGDVLDRLWDAGQRTLPGGGAEVLSERVRRRIEPKKGGPDTWLEVHREAHRRGFKSTATMMYGHVEQVDDLLEHLDVIRELQDLYGGFTAFVPWSFKPNNTLLAKWIKHPKGPNMYLRILAVSRLYLDNFPHVQASWFSEGKRTGQIALHFGADDW